jgi:hypothetical protein
MPIPHAGRITLEDPQIFLGRELGQDLGREATPAVGALASTEPLTKPLSPSPRPGYDAVAQARLGDTAGSRSRSRLHGPPPARQK